MALAKPTHSMAHAMPTHSSNCEFHMQVQGKQIEDLGIELKADIARVRTETEKLRTELRTDIRWGSLSV